LGGVHGDMHGGEKGRAPDAIGALRGEEFAAIRQFAYEHCGLDLHAGKRELVAARLSKQMRLLGLRSFQAYFAHVLEDPSGDARTAMIDALTTNHTSFFREPRHFEFLRTRIVPGLQGRARMEVWCAACATGEEAYSVAIALAEALGEGGLRRIHVLASDLSTRVLATAERGVYAEERFHGLARPLLQRYLLRSTAPGEVLYRMKPAVRAAVEFQHRNLMEDFASLPQFPVIFCRNIMIYFDQPTQQDLVQRLAAQLEPGGYLLIGHSESLNTMEHGLEYVEPATYRKPRTTDGSRKGTR
jgi:chemotaxis protein methyltransferase CheR